MGTGKTSKDTQKIDCSTCGRVYTPMCDFMQGRCPYHPAMFDVSVIKTRFANLINFFKGK